MGRFMIISKGFQSLTIITKHSILEFAAALDSEIKGECKVRDLVKSIEFYNEKFDKFERDNRKKEEKINELEEKTRKMDKKN